MSSRKTSAASRSGAAERVCTAVGRSTNAATKERSPRATGNGHGNLGPFSTTPGLQIHQERIWRAPSSRKMPEAAEISPDAAAIPAWLDFGRMTSAMAREPVRMAYQSRHHPSGAWKTPGPRRLVNAMRPSGSPENRFTHASVSEIAKVNRTQFLAPRNPSEVELHWWRTSDARTSRSGSRTPRRSCNAARRSGFEILA